VDAIPLLNALFGALGCGHVETAGADVDDGGDNRLVAGKSEIAEIAVIYPQIQSRIFPLFIKRHAALLQSADQLCAMAVFHFLVFICVLWFGFVIIPSPYHKDEEIASVRLTIQLPWRKFHGRTFSSCAVSL
jgi:hypothetical protein